MHVTDIAGNEIKPGCLILYAASRGYSSVLSWGRVEKVMTNPERITFRGLEERWVGERLVLRPRLSTLNYPSRIIVIPWEGNIPADVRELLGPTTSAANAIVG